MNPLDDGSAGSLRWAITQANADGGNDTITFDTAGLFASPQTIALTGQLPTITDPNLTITGTGQGMLTVNAQRNGRAFLVGSGATVSISGMLIQNGLVADSGG